MHTNMYFKSTITKPGNLLIFFCDKTFSIYFADLCWKHTLIQILIFIAAKYYILSTSFTSFIVVILEVSDHGPLAGYVKLQVAHAPGMPVTFSPPPRVCDPDMHHGTCETRVPLCMTGSLTSGFIWSRWRGQRYWHSRFMRNPQLYVSGKRPMCLLLTKHYCNLLLGPPGSRLCGNQTINWSTWYTHKVLKLMLHIIWMNISVTQQHLIIYVYYWCLLNELIGNMDCKDKIVSIYDTDWD